MLPFKLVYHEGYDLNLGAHVFPSQKYRLVRDRLVPRTAPPRSRIFSRREPAADEDVRRVHTADYVRKLKTGTLSPDEEARLEVPYSKELIRPAGWRPADRFSPGGWRSPTDGRQTSAADFIMLFPPTAKALYVIHDVAIAIRRLQSDGTIERAMVVDTDVHQGNGTAEIFATTGACFTLSIHQERNYPTRSRRRRGWGY